MALKNFILLLTLFHSYAANSAPVALTASLANVSIPPGGTAQLQVFLDSPRALTSGSVVVSLDPAIFGNIIAADVYSATGDQAGSAVIQGRHVDLEFTSQTAGLGRAPGLPLFTITVPVLATAAPGTKYSLVTSPGTAAWLDNDGVAYSVAVSSGALTVGGDVSIANVGILGGLQGSGSVVEIDGTGFTANTIASIDGVALSGVQFASPQRLNVTLAAAAVLDFRRVAVVNPGGVEVSYFPVLHGNPIASSSMGTYANVQPIFPLQLYVAGASGSFPNANQGFALLNPGTAAADVTINAFVGAPQSPASTEMQLTLPGDGLYLGSVSNSSGVEVIPSLPLRMVAMSQAGFGPMNPYAPSTNPVILNFSNGALFSSLSYTLGQPQPSGTSFYITYNGPSIPYTLSVTTDSGRPWIRISPLSGTSCMSGDGEFPITINCLGTGYETASVDTTQLVPGLNQGTLTITPSVANAKPTVLPFSFTYYTAPSLTFSAATVGLTFLSTAPTEEDVSILSTVGTLPFTVSATTSSGQNWLSFTTTGQTTPATLSVTADPRLLTGASDTGTVVVTGPNNTITLPITLTKPQPSVPAVSPAALLFSAQPGQTTVPPKGISVSPFGLVSASVQTANGGNWLSASASTSVTVTANPTGLPAGTYQGTVTISKANLALPVNVPVTLTISSAAPPAVSTQPAAFSLTAPHGTTAQGTLSVATGNMSLSFSASAATADGSNWLSVLVNNPDFGLGDVPSTPGTVLVTANATNLPPGTYSGTVTVAAPAGSTNQIVAPVSLAVTSAAAPQPQNGGTGLISSVLNAGSQTTSGISPGEILTLFGQNIGPATAAGFALDANGKIASNLGGVQVFFGSVAAPVIYASSTQVNTIVPYEVSGSASTDVSVVFNGSTVDAGQYSVVAASPGIFTAGSGGVGQAAVLNQDNSANSASNPAARGSVIQIYATGAGVTSPGSVTGEVTGTATRQPLLPVTVTMGGVAATVVYAGSAPDAISGLTQVNAVVPMNVAPGAQTLVLGVGQVASQKNVTIVVR